MRRSQLALALLVLSSMATLDTARTEECTSQGTVVTEIVVVGNKLQVNAYPTGYCSPWEALAHGLSAAVIEARRAENARATIAVTSTNK